MNHSAHIRIAALALLLAGAAWAVEVTVPPETGFYRLRSLTFDEVREIAGPFLSPAGKLGFAEARGLVIIHDLPANIAAVRRILEEVDTAPVNIRVEVTFDTVSEGGASAVGVHVDGVTVVHHDGDTRVSGRATGVLRHSRESGHSLTRPYVLAGNNRPARIWAGSEVADPLWVFQYGCRRGWWQPDFVWRELGASLWVRPRVLPDGLIELEVFPKVTARGDEPLSVEVKELTTRVVVADGQPMPLGGLDEEKSSVMRELFGVGQVFSGSRLAITLRADILPVPAAPAAAPR